MIKRGPSFFYHLGVGPTPFQWRLDSVLPSPTLSCGAHVESTQFQWRLDILPSMSWAYPVLVVIGLIGCGRTLFNYYLLPNRGAYPVTVAITWMGSYLFLLFSSGTYPVLVVIECARSYVI